MTKKDRIAIVVSIAWFLFALAFAMSSNAYFSVFLIVASPVLLYWGYRFIKNDISFLNIRDE